MREIDGVTSSAIRRLPSSIAHTVVRTIVNQEEKADERTRTADLPSLRARRDVLMVFILPPALSSIEARLLG